jgi:phosphomannomutase
LSQLGAEFERYAASGEINSTVTDQQGKLAEVEQRFGPGNQVDYLDGLTIRFPDGAWINLRPSNTEPLLRLNVEAADAPRMAQLRDEVLAAIRS